MTLVSLTVPSLKGWDSPSDHYARWIRLAGVLFALKYVLAIRPHRYMLSISKRRMKMENVNREVWRTSDCGAFFEHVFGNVRVNRSHDVTSARPFYFARKSPNGIWIRQTTRNFKTATSAMKAAVKVNGKVA